MWGMDPKGLAWVAMFSWANLAKGCGCFLSKLQGNAAVKQRALQ